MKMLKANYQLAYIENMTPFVDLMCNSYTRVYYR